jgi:broad specificity phosphatase PhoE
MEQLLLVRHAATPGTRRAVFPADEALDAAGLEEARLLAELLPSPDRVVTSPALRARQTAEAAGLDPVVEEDLAECDFGSWAGMSLDEVSRVDPEGLRAWRQDPCARPHGGESLAQLLARVERFLERARGWQGTTVAVTHGGPVRGAILACLGVPAAAFWRMDVAPASLTELHAAGEGWRLVRANWTVARCVP